MNARQASDLYKDLVSGGMSSTKASTFVDAQLEEDYRTYRAQKAEERLKKIEENIAWCIQTLAKLTTVVSELKAAMPETKTQ